MQTKRKLSKDDILKGREKQESLYIQDYDAEVVVRPLTDGELTEVFSLLGTVPLKDDGTPDLVKMDLSKNFDALRLAASRGLVEPKLTPEEVAGMRFGVPEQIGSKVLELSGVGPVEEAKKKGRK